jgi:hypothetical protein
MKESKNGLKVYVEVDEQITVLQKQCIKISSLSSLLRG